MKIPTNKFNHERILNGIVVAFAMAILSFMPISMIVDASDNATDSGVVLTRKANLLSPTGSANPKGEATYEVDNSGQRELEIEVEDLNVANGTILSFFIDGNFVGQAPVSQQKAKLKLKTESGQAVPTVNTGSTVQVKNGGTTILTGVFGAAQTPSPTASPSVSPTGSPSTSPTASSSPTASPSPTGSPFPSPSPNTRDLFAALTGATVNGVLPIGFAQYEIYPNRTELDIRLRQVNLPAGTSLTVLINNTVVGNIIVENNGKGRLRLRSDDGQTVPIITNGTTVTIKNGATTILSGTFTSFTATPSPSPSASPTPRRGKFFKAHLTGSQMVPPVSTNATGEVKVFLKHSETQALITGKFRNLSSAQTSARIEVSVGTTSVVYNFPVTGGTNGNFSAVTIPVTPAQVAQLRAGLWSVVITSVNYPNGEIRGQLTPHKNSSDFDGDGSSDLAVFRPSAGTWYVQNSEGISAQILGGASDKIVSGDYDGDGRTDAAVFQNVNGSGVWTIKRSSDGGTSTLQFGAASDAPVRGDFDGDGRNDLTVFRNGTWYIQKSGDSGIVGVQFGTAGDVPVATDFDDDGKDDIVVFRPSNGVWYYLRSSDGGFNAAQFGAAGDVPIAGDFDGDGKADLSVFRPSNGVWYIERSSDGSFDARQFGANGDIPVAGNFDGDDRTDIAVFRPSTGIWYIWRSLDGTFDFRQFGQNGDVPTPSL